MGCGGCGGYEQDLLDDLAYPLADDPKWQELIELLAAGGNQARVEQLMEYWAHGEGAVKIGWNMACAFCRCLARLVKHVPQPDRLKGLCANLQHRATGKWPNAGHSRVHKCPC